MKQKIAYCLLALIPVLTTACFKNYETVFDNQTIIEFNEAVARTPAVGRLYSITNLPNSVTAGATTIARLNLVGQQRGTDLRIRVLPDPVGTTAAATSYTLSDDGNVVIPANSSSGSLTMTVSRASSTTAPITNVLLVIDSTSTDFKASQNYKRLGYSFRQ